MVGAGGNFKVVFGWLVTDGTVFDLPIFFVHDGHRHLQRVENSFAHESGVSFARRSINQQTEDEIIGIAVSPIRARANSSGASATRRIISARLYSFSASSAGATAV